MEKSLVKKNIHFNQEEKTHVAQMIDKGATWSEVSDWHRVRYGKPMSRSKYFRMKQQKNEILNSRRKNEATDVNAYKRVRNR